MAEGVIEKYAGKHKECFYAAFRIIVGLAFVQHGVQKLFGYLGGQQVELMSLMGAAGTIELVGGILITIGLFTRTAALFGTANMIGAWIIVHLKQGWIPILNGGELALLFFASFIVILSHGAGKYSLSKIMKKG